MSLPYVQTRTGILDHLIRGAITEAEYTLYNVIVVLVAKEGDHGIGVAWTSSVDISNRLLQSWSEDKAKRVLNSLQKKRYIRSWRQKGSRKTYPLQVHKWHVPLGAPRGGIIDAWSTETYDNPVFLSAPHDAPRSAPRDVPPPAPSAYPHDLPPRHTPPVLKRERERERGEEGAPPNATRSEKEEAGEGHAGSGQFQPILSNSATKSGDDGKSLAKIAGDTSTAGKERPLTTINDHQRPLAPSEPHFLPTLSPADITAAWEAMTKRSCDQADHQSAQELANICPDIVRVRAAANRFLDDVRPNYLPLKTLVRQWAEWDKPKTTVSMDAAIKNSEEHRRSIEAAQAAAAPPPADLWERINGGAEEDVK